MTRYYRLAYGSLIKDSERFFVKIEAGRIYYQWKGSWAIHEGVENATRENLKEVFPITLEPEEVTAEEVAIEIFQ